MTSKLVMAFAASAGLLVAVTGDVAQAAERRSATNRALTTCDGFAQEAILTNTQNAAASTNSAIFVPMPSTTITDFDGSGDGGDGVDLYTVTLSGEAFNSGGGNYEVQAQVSIDNGSFLNMYPNQPDTFHSGNPRQTHTMTWCREINANKAQFRILWRKNGGGQAHIDDYLMRVERSD